MQDTYLKFLKNVHSIKENKDVLSYLFVMAKNQALDYYKKTKKEVYIDQYENEDVYGSVEAIKTFNSDLLEKIKKILNYEETQIIFLHAIFSYTHKEIAKILKKPLGTITWKYSRAINKLKEGLGDEYEEF